MKPNTILLIAAAWAAAGATSLNAQEVTNASFETSEGKRILRLEITVNCSLDRAWELFATAEGMRTWMAPVVEIGFRNGGRWEASYDKTKKIGEPGNIVNEVVCVIRKEMYVLRVREVPDNFPFDPEKTYQGRSVLQFEEVGEDRVKVTLTGTGYGEGEEWDRIYNFGVRANGYTLEKLYERVENGPVDWNAGDPLEDFSP